jgi:hypothetical protein
MTESVEEKSTATGYSHGGVWCGFLTIQFSGAHFAEDIGNV